LANLYLNYNSKRNFKCLIRVRLFIEKSLSKLSCVCLLLGKLVNGKHFHVKGKFSLIFRKVFSFYFEQKTLSKSYEKFRNIILFADYVKFDPKTFDCYIFYLNIFFFSISSLKNWFNLIFILTSVLIFMIVIYFSLIIFFNWNFLSIKFGPHSFDYYLFYLK